MIHDIGQLLSSDGTLLLKMWEVSVEPGERPFRKHSHIRFEISKVLAGSGVYRLSDREVPINMGDIIIFSSNEPHCITSVGQDGLKLLNLHFEPRYLWGKAPDSLSEENIGLCFSHCKSFQNKLQIANTSNICTLLESIQTELAQGNDEYSLAVKSYLNLLLILLIREHGYQPATDTFDHDRTAPVRKVINHIDRHLSDPLTLTQLSTIAGMSPNYFSTLFYSVSGIRLWDYINARRIDAAIRLLMKENLTILDIATQCGFNNTANFNKTFKKITGMTPSEYRKSGEYML